MAGSPDDRDRAGLNAPCGFGPVREILLDFESDVFQGTRERRHPLRLSVPFGTLGGQGTLEKLPLDLGCLLYTSPSPRDS